MTEKRKGAVLRTPWIVVVLILVGWFLFWAGFLWQYIREEALDLGTAFILALLPIAVALLGALLWRRRERWGVDLGRKLEELTDQIDAIPVARLGMYVALAAAAGLYAELLMIRLHSSFFQVFAYFKNVSLLSCFLGLGIGYARGGRRPLLAPLVLPLLALQSVALYILRYSGVAAFLQNPISEQVAFGVYQASEVSHMITVYGLLILVFTFNALCFIPLGQLVARLMARQTSSLVAYSWNLAGSLLGIVLFGVLSFLWAPPPIWILLLVLMLLAFLRRQRWSVVTLALAAIICLAILGTPLTPLTTEIYSPYQVLNLSFSRDYLPVLRVNNAYYQHIVDLRPERVAQDPDLQDAAAYYGLPYYFKPQPERVLIVGSGMGNDVAAARRAGAGEIDAVEIDPAILQLGQWLHPELPYQGGNVRAIVDDARAFIRQTDQKYDLIIYGLLDSHTLLSGMSSVRLDSYVYTVEAFREARSLLREDGFIALSFSFVRPAIGHKLYLMLQEAFDGRPPVVYQTRFNSGYTFLIGENLGPEAPPPPPGIELATATFADPSIAADPSTDDWPFFYMPVRTYPFSYVVMIVVLLAVSLLTIRELMPGAGGGGFSAVCFFLGAGFMLIETKGITELALLYGSTWIVTSVVIAAILIMAFLSNLLVMRIPSPRPLVVYGLLFAALVAGLVLFGANLGALPEWLGRVLGTVLLTLPLFFSGIAFSTELKCTASVAGALSANLLGSMLGGLLEYNSMYFGIRSLYVIALLMYGLAAFFALRRRRAT
jgi:spermidine synthase